MEFNIEFILKGIGIMILIGIDVAKDKHDCFIQTSEGKVLCKTFFFANNYDGFEELYAKILACNDADIRVGLEATRHYSYWKQCDCNICLPYLTDVFYSPFLVSWKAN